MNKKEVEKIENRLEVLESLFRDSNEQSLRISPSFIIQANKVQSKITELKLALLDLKQVL